MARKSPAQDKLDAIGTEGIAARIAEGKTYREIAAEAGVGLGRLAAWIESDSERSQACARAREISAQAFEERAQEEIEDAKDAFELAKARELAVHWRWRAKAVNPRRYGERTTLAGDPEAPLYSQLTDEQLQARIAALQSKLNGK